MLLTGWTDYAFSSDNVAAHQAGLSLRSSRRCRSGRRRGVADGRSHDIGIPVGRPQTIVVDLAGRIRPGEHEVRIVTNMRIYWDQILVGNRRTGGSIAHDADRSAGGDARCARLLGRACGLTGRSPPELRLPARDVGLAVEDDARRYTREGDVRALLVRIGRHVRDRETRRRNRAQLRRGAAGALPAGWTRTFLLMADGFSKEMDINSASPDAVEPLPFHGMTRYPVYGVGTLPRHAAYRAYRDSYNTRIVAKPCSRLTSYGCRLRAPDFRPCQA